MIYAYGICEPSVAVPPPGRQGLGGAALRVLEHDGLAAVYSRHRCLRPRPVAEQVVTHERVVEAIMQRGTVLPLRFGTHLEHEGELSEALSKRRSEMLRGLDYVRGHQELGVRVIRASPQDDDGRRRGSGRDYLLTRVAEQRRAERILSAIHPPLDALAAASAVRERPAPPAVVVAAYLVADGAVEEFRRCAQSLAGGLGELDVVVTGPWPPYTFVNGYQGR